jgi:hypothetical protein
VQRHDVLRDAAVLLLGQLVQHHVQQVKPAAGWDMR